MKLINIEHLKFFEGLIYYIKDFNAEAIIQDDNNKVNVVSFDFSIEYKPLGDIVVRIKTQNEMLTQVYDQLVEKIQQMEDDGDFVNR